MKRSDHRHAKWERMRRWKQWHAEHHHYWEPNSWPRYVRARLHRRLFWWFGATILATIITVNALSFIVSRFVASPWHGGGPWRFVLPLLLAWAFLWAAAGKLSRRLVGPLWELAQVARDIGDGKLQSRAKLRWGPPGEIGMLAESINDMAAKIEKQLAEQRELLAAVSHELRTPLGRMRVLIELGRERADAKPQLEELDREVQEIDTLVGELLASARLDFSQLRLQTLDPVAVATRALERANRPLDLLRDESAATQVQGDPTLLARALANLLDNAAKHGGAVRAVRLSLRPGRLSFEVEDDGKGFSDDAMRQLFKPFAGSTSSLGLGLALVRRIAEAHGGAAYARNVPGGGALVGFDIRC